MSEDLAILIQRVRTLRDRSQHLSAEAARVIREADKLMRIPPLKPLPIPPHKGAATVED